MSNANLCIRRFRFVFGFLVLLQTNSAFTAEDPLLGVWKGTIGHAEVVVCFNGDNVFGRAGNYYYTKYKNPIPLTYHAVAETLQYKKPIKIESDTWDERDSDGITGIWLLKTPNAGKLRGIWHSVKDAKALEVNLTIDSNAGNANSCETTTYFDLIDKQRQEHISEFHGKKYRTIQVGNNITLELLTSEGATDRINEQLRAILKEYPTNEASLLDYIARQRYDIVRGQSGDVDEIHVEPIFWTSKWITIRFYRWPAGTGRYGIVSQERTWNMRTGEEVHLWTWFDSKWVEMDANLGVDSGSPTLPLLKLFSTADGCESGGNWHVTLEKSGVQFRQWAMGDGCEKDFVIPYDKLPPFLNPARLATLKEILF